MMIIHSCESCGHPAHDHRNDRSCSDGLCRVKCTTLVRGPSHVAPTFDRDGGVVAEVREPGGVFGGERNGFKLCACDECTSVYSSVLVPF